MQNSHFGHSSVICRAGYYVPIYSTAYLKVCSASASTMFC